MLGEVGLQSELYKVRVGPSGCGEVEMGCDRIPEERPENNSEAEGYI